MAFTAEPELLRRYAEEDADQDEDEDSFVRIMRIPGRYAVRWWAEQGGVEAAQKHLQRVSNFFLGKAQRQN